MIWCVKLGWAGAFEALGVEPRMGKRVAADHREECSRRGWLT
jgi:hypothetical protein